MPGEYVTFLEINPRTVKSCKPLRVAEYAEAGPDRDPRYTTSKGIRPAKQVVPGASGHVTHFENGAF